MSEKGIAMMGTGRSSSKERGFEAASQAVGSELLEDIDLKDARGVLVNITAKEPTLGDFNEVSSVVEKFTDDDAYVIYGSVVDDSFADEDLMVTIVATGVSQKSPKLAVDNARATIKLNPVGLGTDKTKPVVNVGASSAEVNDYLDVPTFMRKQVD